MGLQAEHKPGGGSGGTTARRRPSSRRVQAVAIAALTSLAGLAGCGSDAGAPASTEGPSRTAAAEAANPAPAPAATGATLAAPPSSTAVPPATQSPAASTTVPVPTSSDGPSQSPGDAGRDGVLPAVAELPLDERVHVVAELPAADGQTWVLSELPAGTVQRFEAAAPGRPGDPSGVPAANDYGEVLLLRADGAVVRAWPMPGAPPNWLVVTSDGVYAGHDGDGGLPDSTLARIDPTSLDATVVVIPAEIDGTATGWPSAWHVATGDDVFDYRGAIGRSSGGMTGTKAASPLGDVVVALSSIDGLINRVSGTGG